MYYLIENVISFVTLSAAVACWWGNRRASVAILISLISGLVLSEYNLTVYHPFAMLVGAWFCLVDFKDGKLSALGVAGNEVNHAIVYLYCMRVIVELLRMEGVGGVETMWVITTVMLLIQLSLATGSVTGYASRLNNFLNFTRGNVNNTASQ